jgi:hypothetical protein
VSGRRLLDLGLLGSRRRTDLGQDRMIRIQLAKAFLQRIELLVGDLRRFVVIEVTVIPDLLREIADDCRISPGLAHHSIA